MLGYTEQELVGTKITDYAHPYSKKGWQQLQEKLWKHEMPSSKIEVNMIRKDGSTLWCSVTTILFQDQEATLGYTILENITERKTLIEKLSNSESMLSQSGQAAGVGSFITDFEKGMVQSTPVLNNIFGFPGDEILIHKNMFMAVLDPQTLEKHEQILAKAIEQGSAYTSEYKIVVQGEQKWIWEKGEVRKDREGNVTIVGAAQDVTAQKQQQKQVEQLAVAYDFLSEIQKTVHIGAYEMDIVNLTVRATPEMYQMMQLEVTRDTNPYQLFKDATYPEDRIWAHDIVADSIAHDKAFAIEHRLSLPNDEVLWVLSVAKLVADEFGQKTKLVGVLVDITEKKSIPILEKSNKKLSIRNDELDSFVYTASHDLRAPLNNMEMLVGFLAKQLKSTQENATVGVYINLLEKSITDLKTTLEDLTTVTEIHAGEKKELVNLHTIIEEVQMSLFKQIEEATATVQVDLAVPFLRISKKHARSLVFNMLSNALKFRSKDRKLVVSISSHLQDSKIHLSFSDNGIGIREADQPKVFMIFKRFNPEVAGRGVGMYLVKRIIDLNDGNIYLESKENIGTSFHIEFPISQ